MDVFIRRAIDVFRPAVDTHSIAVPSVGGKSETKKELRVDPTPYAPVAAAITQTATNGRRVFKSPFNLRIAIR